MTGPDSEGLQAEAHERDVEPAIVSAVHRVVDCRSSAGEAMAMIDAAIHCLRVASRGDTGDPVVIEALRDLVADPEVGKLLSCKLALPSSPVVPAVGAVPVEVPEEALRAGACALANVVRLPDWLQVRALGHDMRPLAQLALAAAYPLIAARVQAEAEAAERARVAREGVVTDWDGESNVVSVTFSIAALQAHNARTAAVVRAEERQRITGDLARVSIHPFKGPDDTDMSMLLEAAKRIEGGYAAGGSNTRETTVRVLRFVAGMLAAGSAVPVAQCGKTNQEAGMPDFYYQDWRCGKPVGHEGHCTPYSAETAELRAAAVPVATPTDPMDEVVCPGCGATIRAQMSDRSTPERGAALEDLEHALTLALQAMAENDCCADEDDPDWRGPAIEQFRQESPCARRT